MHLVVETSKAAIKGHDTEDIKNATYLLSQELRKALLAVVDIIKSDEVAFSDDDS